MDIDKLSKRYLRQSICITAAIFLAGLLAVRVWYADGWLWPMIVSAVFTLLVDVADALVWKFVAAKHPDSLVTFYSAVSGFRLLLALAVMFVYYLATGRQSMALFFLIFMAFYVASLVHHTVFFSRISSRL